MIKKNKLILCIIFLFIHQTVIAKENPLLKLADIPIVYNIDSLEQTTRLLDKKSDRYLLNILSIEWSRLQIRAGKYGLYCAEIDSLSRLHQQPIGKAFTEYISASSSLQPGYPVNHYLLNKAENALKLFEINKDEYGIFFSNSLIARLYTSRVYQGNPDDAIDVQKDRKEELIKIKEHNHIADSIAQKSGAPFLWVYNNLHKAKTNMTIHIRDQQLEPAKKICWETIEYLKNSKSKSHYTSLAYLFYANALNFQDSLEKAIYFEKAGLSQLLPAQSELQLATFISLANNSNTLDQIDSSMVYCRKALALMEGNDFKNDYDLLNLYENMVSNFEEKKMLDSALFYAEKLKFAAFNYFNHQNENEQKNFKFGLAFSLEKQRIEAQNKRNKQILLFSAIILLLLLFTIFFISKARQKLSRAYVQIQELQHSREKFYSIIAHDLRSPLDSYQGLANTLNYLLKNKQYDQIEKISRRIDENGSRIQSMLRNLFQWSLAEQQKLNYTAEPVDTSPFLAEIIPLYSEIAANKNLQLLVETEGKPVVLADKNYLATVVRNLLDNAIKYAVPDSIIQIKTGNQENKFVLQISNKGKIDVQKAEIIRALLASKKEWQPGEKGIGLGLILIRDFTAKMEGQIKFTSSEDEIIFLLKLPLFY